MGLEALSRGVQEAHFIELDPWVLQNVLKRNVRECRMEAKSKLYASKVGPSVRGGILLLLCWIYCGNIPCYPPMAGPGRVHTSWGLDQALTAQGLLMGSAPCSASKTCGGSAAQLVGGSKPRQHRSRHSSRAAVLQ